MLKNLTPVVKNLLIINVVLLVLTYILQNFGIDLVKLLGLFYFKSEYFMPYQYITHMFMHGGIIHLLFNMYALILFGSILERVWGPKRFLIYYFFAGLGAAALHTAVSWYMINDFYTAVQDFITQPYLESFKTLTENYPKYFAIMQTTPTQIIDLWRPDQINNIRTYVDTALQAQMNIPTIGASGAVFGLLLAFGMMFPDIPLMIIFIPIKIKAKYFVIGYGVLELVSGVANAQSDHIAHFAHLGGMLFGFILLKIWYKGNLRQNNNHF